MAAETLQTLLAVAIATLVCSLLFTIIHTIKWKIPKYFEKWTVSNQLIRETLPRLVIISDADTRHSNRICELRNHSEATLC